MTAPLPPAAAAKRDATDRAANAHLLSGVRRAITRPASAGIGALTASAAEASLPALFFLAGLLGAVLPFVAHGNLPGDVGDPRFNMYVLEHFHLALGGQVASFLDAPFFYPWPDTIAFSDLHWGTGAIYSLLRTIAFTPTEAFAGWFAIGFVLNYWIAYVVARRFSVSRLGSAVAASLFTFGLPVVAQADHAQLIYRPFVPIAFLVLHRCLTQRQWLRLGLVFLLLALQVLISVYTGVFLLYALLSYSLVFVIIGRRDASAGFPVAIPKLPAARLRRRGVAALQLLCGAAILAVVAAPYLRVQALYGFQRHWPEIRGMLPRFASYAYAGGHSVLWPDGWVNSRSLSAAHEHQLFIGLGAVMVLAYAWLSGTFARRRLARQMLATTMVLVVATLCVANWSLYYFATLLPGLSAVRAVTRIIFVMLIPVAMAVGATIDDMEARGSARIAALMIVAAVLVILESALATKFISTARDWSDRLARLAAEVPPHLAHDAVLVVATPHFDARTEIDAMLLAQELGIRTLNGYSGNQPDGWVPMQTCDDVAAVLAAGEAFARERLGRSLRVDRGKLVYVGFGEDCSQAVAIKPELPVGQVVDFSRSGKGRAYFDGGWSRPEDWGTWSTGPRASLAFRLAEGAAGGLRLRLIAYGIEPAPGRPQPIRVSVDGHPVTAIELGFASRLVELDVPESALTRTPGDHRIDFDIGAPTRPADRGFSADSRRLGIALKSLMLVDRSPP